MGKQTGCYADSIAANPNRPTVANPADITQSGVLELEYGWDRQWPEEGRQQASVGGRLKFGMLCDVELRWNTTSFLSQTDASGTHRSFGDNWLGPQIRVYRSEEHTSELQSPSVISYAVFCLKKKNHFTRIRADPGIDKRYQALASGGMG